MPNDEQRSYCSGPAGFSHGLTKPSNLISYTTSSFAPINRNYTSYQSPSISRNSRNIGWDSETCDLSIEEPAMLPRKSNKRRQFSKGTKYLATNDSLIESDEDIRDIFEIRSPERKETVTSERPKPQPSKQRRVTGSKSERVLDVIKESVPEQVDDYLEPQDHKPMEPTKLCVETTVVLNSVDTKSLSSENENLGQNFVANRRLITTTAEKARNRFDGLTNTTLDTLAGFWCNANAAHKNTGPVQKLTVTAKNRPDIPKSFINISEHYATNSATNTSIAEAQFNPTIDNGYRNMRSFSQPEGEKNMSLEPNIMEFNHKSFTHEGDVSVMDFEDIPYKVPVSSGYELPQSCQSDRMLPEALGPGGGLSDDDIADADILSLVNNIPTMPQSDFVSQNQAAIYDNEPYTTDPTAESFDTYRQCLQSGLWLQTSPLEPSYVNELGLSPLFFDKSDNEYQIDSEDEKEMINILGAATCSRNIPIQYSSPPSAFAGFAILKTPPKTNCIDLLSERITTVKSTASRSPKPSGLPTPVSTSKKRRADTLHGEDNLRRSAYNVLKLNFDHEILKPFARPNFPAPVFERCPVIGVTSRTVLRTCFRVGEMLREGGRCKTTNQNAVIELYARVISSSRELYSMKQHFKFADLFHERPPFPNGVLLNYKTTSLIEIETNGFLETGESVLARCLGTLQKDPKDEAWTLQIANIRKTNWSEIAMTKRVVCGKI